MQRKLDFEEIQIPPGPRLQRRHRGRAIFARGFGDRSFINGLSFSLLRNGIVGIIVFERRCKTTLFKTIVGLEPL